MPVDIHSFEQPESTSFKIWRYLDFTKYVSMLDSQALFFAPIPSLKDRFEGTIPRGSYNTFKRHMAELQPSWSDQKIEERARKAFAVLTSARLANEVSCWHQNENESEAMWKLYLKSDEGIAIESTYSALASCFEGKHEVALGKVRYADYDALTSVPNVEIFMLKRPSFAHEQEVRASVVNAGAVVRHAAGEGTSVPVNLTTLVKRVVVAPGSPSWLLPLIRRVTQKYGYEFEVAPSSLDAEPVM
jgi:hypothetical protein